jgi:hypothetical protein
MAAIAERIEARDGAAEIGDQKKECAERIEAKPAAHARQADRQAQRFGRQPSPQMPERGREPGEADNKARAVDRREAPRPAADQNARSGDRQQSGDTPKSGKGRDSGRNL